MNFRNKAITAALTVALTMGTAAPAAFAVTQSDVDAGRLLASACFARLHTSKAYLKQLRKAQREFKRLYQRP